MKPLKRREIKGLETSWVSIKLPAWIHETIRDVAFKEGKTVSLVITELLAQGVQAKEAGNVSTISK